MSTKSEGSSSEVKTADARTKKQPEELPECFIIMPIGELDTYPTSHFRHVYEGIFKPACQTAGFKAVRADDYNPTNFIALDILQKLIEAPMAVCDLSTRNPNVLFELGIRQAFDKPVALVQEIGTPAIFDIAALRYSQYHKEMFYHQVLEDQTTISTAIQATSEAYEKGQGINSLVKLLSLTQPAALTDVAEADQDPMLQLVRAELNSLRDDLALAATLASQTAIPRVRGGDYNSAELESLNAMWGTIKGFAKQTLSSGVWGWFRHVEPVAIKSDIVFLGLFAQDSPSERVLRIIEQFVKEQLGARYTVTCTVMGIPSQ